MAKRAVGVKVSVYKATHIDTGRAYVGLTSQWPPEIRWRQHVWDALNPKREKAAFQRAIKKHGPEAFKFEVLETVGSAEEGRLLEQKMITEHNTMRPNGFNLTTGGEMAAGFHLSEETKRKIGAFNKRRCNGGPAFPARPPEVRSAQMKAYYAANPKPPESDETRRRKSEASKAYWDRRRQAHASGEIPVVAHKSHRNSEQAKMKLAEHARRQWLTRSRAVPADVIAKHSAAMRVRWADPDYKRRVGAAISEAYKKKKLSCSAQLEHGRLTPLFDVSKREDV